MGIFKLCAPYAPAGDQPSAIAALSAGLKRGDRAQTLLGVTGSGKTFTMASVIEKVNRPTLVLAHNKTLAAQLCEEFREFFPNNAVEYKFIPGGKFFGGIFIVENNNFKNGCTIGAKGCVDGTA